MSWPQSAPTVDDELVAKHAVIVDSEQQLRQGAARAAGWCCLPSSRLSTRYAIQKLSDSDMHGEKFLFANRSLRGVAFRRQHRGWQRLAIPRYGPARSHRAVWPAVCAAVLQSYCSVVQTASLSLLPPRAAGHTA